MENIDKPIDDLADELQIDNGDTDEIDDDLSSFLYPL
jgi:hypothetical protein